MVYPLVTDTGGVTDPVREYVKRRAELNVAAPEKVAEVIAFLSSDCGRLVTANIIHLRQVEGVCRWTGN